MNNEILKVKNLDVSWSSFASKGLDDIVQTLNLQIAGTPDHFLRVMGISEQPAALWSPYAVSPAATKLGRFSKRHHLPGLFNPDVQPVMSLSFPQTDLYTGACECR